MTNHRRLIGCLMLAACALLSASPAVADTFHVTSLADGGPGTLRSAIEQAPFGVDATTIVFDVEGTINLTSPLFILAKIINIQGPGAATLVVSGNQTFPILRNISGSVTTISGVTIQNGRAVSNVNGAGIYNNATLTVADCVITNNHSDNFGGGIYNELGATLVVAGSMVSDNSAFEGGGGLRAYWNSTTFINTSTFARNSSAKGGGAVYGAFATIDIVGTTFANNAALSGGAVQIDNGLLRMTNSTIYGNTAENLAGGLMVNNGLAYVSHTTMANNSATLIPGALAATQGLYLKNSVLAHAANGGNCVSLGALFTSGGKNVIDDFTCPLSDSSADIRGVSAGLDPSGLQDNGGPTATVALLTTSPAIDAIAPGACTTFDGALVTIDQRGIARPIGAGCDAGAFESAHIPTPAEETAALMAEVQKLLLPAGIERSLIAKLESALKILAAQRPAQLDQSRLLQAFIYEVNAQRGKNISGTQADALVAAATHIIQRIQGH